MTNQFNLKFSIIASLALIVLGCGSTTNTTSDAVTLSNNTTASNVTAPKPTVSDNPFQVQIDSILALMTLDEKLGQLNLPVSGDITTGQGKSSNVANKIREGKVGGMFNIKSVEKIKAVQKIAVEESRLGIPLLFGMDVIHGYETTFPIPLGLSSSWTWK